MVVIEDLAPRLCEVHHVVPREDRPCLALRGLLTKEECAEWKEKLQEGFSANSNLNTYTMARTQFQPDFPELSALVWERLAPHLPAELDGGTAFGLRANWHCATYAPGQWVGAHLDLMSSCAEQKADPTVASRITLTMYLEEDYEGAEFVFVKGIEPHGYWYEEHYRPEPKTGDAILFYQQVQEFEHAVRPLTSGSKTIMRSDVLYKFASVEEAGNAGRHIEGGAPAEGPPPTGLTQPGPEVGIWEPLD